MSGNPLRLEHLPQTVDIRAKEIDTVEPRQGLTPLGAAADMGDVDMVDRR